MGDLQKFGNMLLDAMKTSGIHSIEFCETGGCIHYDPDKDCVTLTSVSINGARQSAVESRWAGWVSVAERLPEEELVFVHIPHRDYLIAEWHDDHWWNDQLGRVSGVTHWRELPAPPEDAHD